MSLDQLVGPTIQLVVYIKEGHGFGFLTTPITVTSSLLGHVLATDVEPPSPEPHFDYELTYEINKKLIKRLRVDNTSLKIDCYATGVGRKDRIGYILLNLKELQIVPRGAPITEAWHRVLGLSKEARVLGPQLLLSFYITDIPNDDPIHTDLQAKQPVWKKSHNEHTLTAYIKEDEGIIQIGPDKTCTSNFALTFSIAAAVNISQLIDVKERDVEPGLSVVYSMLGYTVQTKAVTRVDDTLLPNEKIVIRLRSTLNYLSELTEPLKVDLVLKFGDDEIGTSSFLLEDLTKNLKKVIEKHCIMSSTKIDPFLAPEQQPCLEVAVCFARESKPVKKTMDLRTIESHRYKDEDRKKPNRPGPQQTSVDQKGQTVSMPTVRLNLTSLNKTCPKTAPGGSTYRAAKDEGPLQNYILSVVVDSIQLSELPQDGKVSFRFHHAEANIKTFSNTEVTLTRANETVNFSPIQAEFYFKLPANHHQSCLLSQPPEVTVSSEGKVLASTLLHLGILFSHDQKKCSYTAILEGETYHKGLLGVTMSLDENLDQVQIQSPVCVPDEHTYPSPLRDDQLMLKVVEELEDWKEKQQEIFKAELMRKESEYLAKVSADWEEKKRRLEEMLVFNVENSQTVLDSLNTATENLRLRKLKLKEKELKLQHEKEELKRKFIAKTQELRIASQRMKDEQALKTSQAIMEKVGDLEKKVKALEVERDDLEKKVNTFEQENLKIKEGFLNKEQADIILKEMENLVERFEKEKQSKIFYKTEWGKSVREQRKIRKLYDESMKKQIERNNEELRMFAIHHIASDHDKALQEDQLKLLGLKSEVLSWRKGQGDSARSGGTDPMPGSMHSNSQFYTAMKDADERYTQCEEAPAGGEYLRNDDVKTVKALSQQIKEMMMT